MSLFDGDKFLSTIKDPDLHSVYTICFLDVSDLTRVILEQFFDVITKNAVLLQNLRECVEKHLNNCGRRWVDLKSIFSLMKI